MNRVPKKFVGIHAHCGFSPFDGLGYPDEHFKFAMENGLDAHAITDHGNSNAYAHAQLFVEKWAKEHPDVPFKYIPGVEAYFHPDLDQWERDKNAAEKARDDKKLAKKLAKEQEQFQTKLIVNTDENDDAESIEMSNALTIENEDESKSTRQFNPVNRRHHLVLLAKDTEGLKKIFGLISRSYLHGFYRFPRIDAKGLKEACKDGNVIASSACLHPNTKVITDCGSMKLVELVDRVQKGEAFQVLSYDIDECRLVFKPVSWAACTRKNSRLLRVKLKNGQTLRLTADHKVYTDKGWIEAQHLTKTHRILAIHR